MPPYPRFCKKRQKTVFQNTEHFPSFRGFPHKIRFLKTFVFYRVVVVERVNMWITIGSDNETTTKAYIKRAQNTSG